MYLKYWIFSPLLLALLINFQAFAEEASTSTNSSASSNSSEGSSSSASTIKPYPKLHGTQSYFQRFDENYFPGYLKTAYSQFKKEDYEQAVDTIENIEATKGAFIKRIQAPEKLYFLKALCLAGLNRAPESQKALLQALSFKASNPDILLLKAINEAEQSKPQLALASLNEALWFGKTGVIPKEEIQYTIGLVYKMTSDLQKSADSLNAALTTNGQFSTARTELAALELERGNKQQAINLLRQALQGKPQDFELNLQLAKALLLHPDRTLNKNDLSEAKKITTELMKPKDLEKPQFLAALPVHVNALLANGLVEDAEKQVDLALKQNPTLPELQALKQQVQIEKSAKS